ncbi:transposase [Clostridium butyricum E4 str. BoNT E BL5262]|uniref:Transposase n=1 Tax=Clostridium butyricum E4 str. BoNT E BL5262 TaxID=632245 RepID=C4IM19_CLOBU|nr:helix-turn-helix domain protein [Clostridium butyricum]EEP52792.1 transposase [Clostridium butyricum E4 str. BoNT E BL5262]
MSKITFDKSTIELLNENPYVVKVSEKSITYSNEFKRLFIEEYLKDKTPKVIFNEFGFDTEVLGKKRYEQAAARWIKSYRADGIIGLRDTRRENSGRTSEKNYLKMILFKNKKLKLSY